MANFDKFANLDPAGWTRATATLAAKAGKHVHIGLWGDGPKGEALEVRPADATICTVHEERNPAHYPGWRHFLITPIRAGMTRLEALIPGTKTSSATMTLVVAAADAMRLVFFPGEQTSGEFSTGTIYLVGGGHGETMRARGGYNLPGAKLDKEGGGHEYEATPTGLFVLGPKVHVTTKSWPTSAIPFGTPLRLTPDREVEYCDRVHGWTPATGHHSMLPRLWQAFKARSHIHISRAAAEAVVRSWFLNNTGGLILDQWIFNDFGEWGWNLTKNGKPTGFWVHTTPKNEVEAMTPNTKISLFNSHGCVHINPKERDAMMKAGYLVEGMPFEVRPYSESGPPPH